MTQELEPLDPTPVSALYSTTFYTVAAGGAGVLMGLVRAKTAAVYLGDRGVGILAQLNYLGGWAASIAALGLATACIKVIAEARGREDHETVARVQRFVFVVPLLLGLTVTLAIAAFSSTAAGYLLGSSELSGYVLVAAATIPLSLLVISASTVLRGHGQARAVAAIELASSAVNTVLVVVVVVVWGMAGAIAGVLATSLVSVAAYLVQRPHSLGPLRRLRGPLPSRSILKGITIVALAAFVWGTATRTTDLVVRSIIVNELGIAANGIYQPAFQVSNQVMLTLMMGTSVYLLARLSELAGSKDMTSFAREWNQGMRLMTMITFAAIAILIPMREIVVRLLYTDAFVPGARLFPLQLTGDFFRMLVWAATAALLPLGHVRDYISLAIAGRILNIVVAATLIGSMGLVAVSLGYAIDWISTTALTIAFLKRRGLWLFTRSTLVAAVGSMAAIAGLATTAVTFDGWPAASISLAIVLGWGALVIRAADITDFRAIFGRGPRADRAGGPR